MRSKRLLWVLALAALYTVGPIAAVQRQMAPTAGPFVLGLVRWNGAIEIVGRFTGQTWVNTWPVPAEFPVPVPAIDDVPDTWLGRPVPRQWTIWSKAGPLALRVTG